MRDFADKIFNSASALALLNLVASLAIYLSGYIIVNAYLSKNYILQTQILHTSYISAGMSFVFVNLIAAVTASPTAYFFSWLIIYREKSIKKNPKDRAARNLLTFSAILVGLLFILLFSIVFGYIVGKATSSLLGLASRTNPSAVSQSLFAPLFQIYWRLILVYMLLFGVIVAQSRLIRQGGTLVILTSLSLLVFGFMTYYSILVYADKVYAALPVTIGGGQPQHIRIYMEKEKGNKYQDIFAEYGSSFFADYEDSDKLISSVELELYWQIGQTSTVTEAFSGFAVRPISCENCPILIISPSDISSVGYFP